MIVVVKLFVLTSDWKSWIAPAEGVWPTSPSSFILIVRFPFNDHVNLIFTVSYICANSANILVISVSSVVTATEIAYLFTRADCRLIRVPYKLYCGVQIFGVSDHTRQSHELPFNNWCRTYQLELCTYRK